MAQSPNSMLNPERWKKNNPQPNIKTSCPTTRPPKETVIPLADIKCDPILQGRPLIPEKVQQYKEWRLDGNKLPPISVVQEGKTYWLWDGYHRFEAAKQTPKVKTVAAYVTIGTKRDAHYLALGANKEHGIPRTSGEVRRRIEEMLDDPEWTAIGSTEMACHIGASRRYVIEVKKEWAAKIRQHEGGNDESEDEEPEPAKCDQTVTNRVDAPKNAVSGVNCSHPITGGNCPETALATTTEQVEVKRVAPLGEMVDSDGVSIPEDLRAVFAQAGQMEALAAVLSNVKRQMTIEQTSVPEAWERVEIQRIAAGLEMARIAILDGRPFLVCSTCAGIRPEDCKCCRGKRWLTVHQGQLIDIDTRTLNRKAHGLPPITK